MVRHELTLTLCDTDGDRLMDPDRRRKVLRLAAEYVERKHRGEPVTWSSDVRVTPLDAEGNPSGPAVQIGPLIYTERWSLPDTEMVAERAAQRTTRRTGRLR